MLSGTGSRRFRERAAGRPAVLSRSSATRTAQVLRCGAADRRELRGGVAGRAPTAPGARGGSRATCCTATPSSRRRTSPRRPPRRAVAVRVRLRGRARTRSPGTRPAARSTSGCVSTTAAASSRCPASSARRPTRRARCCTAARSLGLRPYGITFHVGSQCTSTTAWVQAIALRRPADAAAAQRRHRDRDAGHRRRLPGAVRRRRARTSSRSARSSSRRWASCSRTCRPWWRPSPAGTWSPRPPCWSRRSSAARCGRARSGSTSTSAPTTA